MDWIVWLVVIIVVVAVVWWLLNRNKNRPGPDSTSAGMAGTAGTGNASGAPGSSTTAPTASPEAAGSEAAGSRAVGGAAAGGAAVTGAAMAAPEATRAPEAAGAPASTTAEGVPKAGPAAGVPATEQAAGTSPNTAPESSLAADNSEWETQWSETGAPTDTHPAGVHHEPAHGAHVAGAAAESPAATSPAAEARTGVPVHHPEYTEPHAPTLPGAESAAAEPADDDVTAGEFTGAGEPTGHLATEQPYGEGSAAPAADGSGPEGFTVKGDASSMIYHDETSPAYEETRAEVWFISAAHAEAAGFRPPRRTRL